jgi:hypothetical protein
MQRNGGVESHWTLPGNGKQLPKSAGSNGLAVEAQSLKDNAFSFDFKKRVEGTTATAVITLFSYNLL